MTSGVSFFSHLFSALESFTPPSTIALWVLAIAALIDYVIGDPWGWPHPVRVMGWAIARYQEIVFHYLKSATGQRLAGVFLGLGLVIGSGWVGWAIATGTTWIHAGLGIAVQSILLASCFAGRSLRSAAEDVMQPLSSGDLAQARTRLSFYVGRDTENLSEPEVLRAILETVTENATDGVMAPLFYALLGAALPGVGVVPLAIAYKAASTLDSMVGYKEAPYTHLGWFSAQMEDRLTWLPCRLVVLTLALLSRKPGYVWRICRRDAIADASPNSGWSECAYAAVLGVQVGGTNWYRGVAKHKPLLGEPIHVITPEQIYQALQLTRISFLLWLGLGLLGLSLWSEMVFSTGQLP
ncbi:adenosylcobinamide-phosphate synthase CbiB [Trichocoleus desertorum AS-A10]|uniref:adenosylcobinamide-phosphate synthase CbiB n=1 Tax=Trichocoleus desertorum TaxID=1481672 RepID=UPI0032973340